ncbi:MAG TPA: hypothetical protein PKE55_04425 [Kiritimatiellia bacterium]|nr:hypothetical protein [Kiritimatiellia bacterium]
MKHSIRVLAVAVMAASVVFTMGASGQTLPSHGAVVTGAQPGITPTPAVRPPSYMAWRSDVGLDFIYLPSTDDKRFDEALGIGVNVTFPLQQILAIRTGIAFESLQGKTGIPDADVIPLSLSFLIGPPPRTAFNGGVELGLRYNIVDYKDEGGDYDNGVGAYAGVNLSTALATGFGLEFGAGYRFDISGSKNDANEKLSLEGLGLRLSLRFAF